MGTAFMATEECPISDRYKQALVEGEPWDPKIRDRALAPPKIEEYQKVMKEKGSMPTSQWLARLEMVLIKESPDTAIDWESAFQEWDPEVAFRISGGSLAVGVIDRVKSTRELIDDIIQGAERILSAEGTLGRISETSAL